MEESMAGHMDMELGKEKQRGAGWCPGGIQWQTACFYSPGDFKTFTNLWEGRIR
jgi:hypothetical protein